MRQANPWRIQKLARKGKNMRLDINLAQLVGQRPIGKEKHDRTKASAIQILDEIEERDFAAAKLGGVVDVENRLRRDSADHLIKDRANLRHHCGPIESRGIVPALLRGWDWDAACKCFNDPIGNRLRLGRIENQRRLKAPQDFRRAADGRAEHRRAAGERFNGDQTKAFQGERRNNREIGGSICQR